MVGIQNRSDGVSWLAKNYTCARLLMQPPFNLARILGV